MIVSADFLSPYLVRELENDQRFGQGIHRACALDRQSHFIVGLRGARVWRDHVGDNSRDTISDSVFIGANWRERRRESAADEYVGRGASAL